MFTGKVETHEAILKTQKAKGGLRIWVKKPSFYPSLKTGDSLAVNGVCLTLEIDTKKALQFFVSKHSLFITGWDEVTLKNKSVNLERPLFFGSPLHGHLVTGHVEAHGRIKDKKSEGEGLRLFVDFPSLFRHDFFNKASIALNGVSLTLAQIHEEKSFEVYLIPETLKKTNLGLLNKGDKVNLESDFMLKSLPRNKQDLKI